jgi:hypothetical protein
LGIDDTDITHLRWAGEGWLATEAPHEFEHYLTFRVAYTLEPVVNPRHVILAWKGSPDFYVIPDASASVAVNRGNFEVQRTIFFASHGKALIVRGQAFSDLGLGNAIRYDIERAVMSSPESFHSIAISPLAKLPFVRDCLRERECNEFQIPLEIDISAL